MTLIDAKFNADLINISEVTSRKTKWPRFFWPTLYNQIASDVWKYNNPVYKLMTNNEQTATGVN